MGPTDAVLIAYCWSAGCLTVFLTAGVIASGLRFARAEVNVEAVARIVEETAREESEKAVRATRQMAQNALQRADDALERSERAANAVAARTLTRK